MPQTPKPKTYSFTREERWFILEHNSFITFYNNLVKSYVDQVVIPRLGIKPDKGERIKIKSDASGMEVIKVEVQAEPEPAIEVAKK